jgi:Sulfotransferase family
MARLHWEQMDEGDEYRHICRARVDHVVRVQEPLVLVSQVQRSGGTLLSRLFDGHPECHAHPYELTIGPRTVRWPSIDLAKPERWFETLFEEKALEHLVSGYTKPGLKGPDVDVLPFTFLPRLQKQIFDACIEASRIERERDVFDCYFTSYFNAWLDNQNLYSKPKRIVIGFRPRTNLKTANVERFLEVYPDGTLVSLVREPRGWYASASRHRRQYEDLDEALAVWRRSTEASIANRERFGDRVVLLTYEELVLETEATMRRLAERFGITMSPVLLTPTYNGRAVRANSSDPVADYGVLVERASAYGDVLDPALIARVDELAGDLYARVQAQGD